MPDFCHLHCHTQFSLLDGASDISTMMDKAVADGQTAVALTDHGNMFGAYKFVNEASKRGIKPIVGCEFYLVENRHKVSFEKAKGERDTRYHQLLLAKNKVGYENLSKLCSLGYTEGLYSKWPRIDKEILKKFSEGVIATSCCIGAEIPQALIRKDYEKAEKLIEWWLDVFGEDFYIEIQRHAGLENLDYRDENGKRQLSGVSQEDINQDLLRYAEKYNIKVIATNDTHYVEEEDWLPHDILLCVNTGSFLGDENRFKFASSDFYFKNKSEMQKIFSDVPFALDNTLEIAGKIDTLNLARDIVLPAFPLPPGFKDQDDYLYHLTMEGAKARWGDILPEVKERLEFELGVIRNSGYPGYFLIVQDFTTEARNLGVSVGPGRGSAAGSAVAYCLGITNIDPIKYDLLFERFLNPERVSMPDIDIDFDDEGRQKVIDYVIDKYGKEQVAQIITYGTMAAKSAIKDVGRVMEVPLVEVNQITKDFPGHAKASLKKILKGDDIDPKLKGDLDADDLMKANRLRELAAQDTPIGDMLRTATKLEGSIRNTGIHACGVIITPDEMYKYVPVSTAKGSDMQVSQFDNSVVEDAGLLKMDFLGLRTLSIIKDCIEMIKKVRGIEVDIENVDLEDEKTYELFGNGATVGVFQYESAGMQKSLIELKPNKFEDLIAMNALYRPGPLQYIPDFIKRKHGQQEITYDLDDMEEYLEETYGITVYQEQVMLLSQKLANFSKGQADMLRKAMGKKKKKLIDEMWPIFLEGCKSNGHDEKTVKKVWSDWEAFASYAFNKSHSTCYAFVAFQTAFLKANYPEEFMSSVLNHSKSIDAINFNLQECKRMDIDVLGPDINYSFEKFHVSNTNEIRFGLTALKGVGEGPVSEILAQREESGHYQNIFDFIRKVSGRAVNKKAIEALVLGGAFDSFKEINRATFFAPSGKYDTFIEHLIRYGNAIEQEKNNAQASLFGGSMEQMIEEPAIKLLPEWDSIIRLDKEKDVTGIYISGHPLDDYELEMKNFVNCTLDKAEQILGQDLKLAGIVTDVYYGETKRGGTQLRFTVSDYKGSMDFRLFNDECEKNKHVISVGTPLYLEGINRKYQGQDRTYFKLLKVKMLDSIADEMTNSITIKINIDNTSEDEFNSIIGLFEKYIGGKLLKIKLVDSEDNYVDLKSTIYKVNPNFEFINALKEFNLPYKLN